MVNDKFGEVMVEDKILEYLKGIEEKSNVRILYACESGSRAWGFPSPDSDFDIRFIYVHSVDWYLSIDERKDAMDYMFENGDIDLSGWELRKALRLLKGSNMSLLEWPKSPIVYRANTQFLTDVQFLGEQFYSRIKGLHHYLSLARKMTESLVAERSFKLKKMLYALRAATNCRWILDRSDPPPVEFKDTYSDLGLSSELTERIDELIEFKQTKNESYLHTGEQLLVKYILDCIDLADTGGRLLPSANGKVEDLNRVLRKYIYENDHS
ncbi:MAG: nucleotidyltransferase domain-containing protein [Bacteroidota bacterium]